MFVSLLLILWGIKLGGGGLIRAYSGAVRDVIYDIGRRTA